MRVGGLAILAAAACLVPGASAAPQARVARARAAYRSSIGPLTR